jgi:hypothetical protein
MSGQEVDGGGEAGIGRGGVTCRSLTRASSSCICASRSETASCSVAISLSFSPISSSVSIASDCDACRIIASFCVVRCVICACARERGRRAQRYKGGVGGGCRRAAARWRTCCDAQAKRVRGAEGRCEVVS